MVVTKSKYGPAASRFADDVWSAKPSRNVHRVRQDELGDRDPDGEENERERDPRPDLPVAPFGVRPGATKAHSW